MFTDIVEFSKTMSKDEDKGFALIDQHRKIVKPLIKEYKGILAKEMCDSTLSFLSQVQDKCSNFQIYQIPRMFAHIKHSTIIKN